jgi:dihydrofolate reductase
VAGKVLYHVTMSLDGFIAGPGDAMDWVFKYPGPKPSPAGAEVIRTTGAILAGRRLYDLAISPPGGKPYGGAWTGPVFVLTHKPPEGAHDPSVRFLSGSIQDAVATALDAAGGKSVVLFGATIPQQCIQEGLLDEIVIHLVPVLLGDGIRFFSSPGIKPINLEKISVAESGSLTDLRFRVAK